MRDMRGAAEYDGRLGVQQTGMQALFGLRHTKVFPRP